MNALFEKNIEAFRQRHPNTYRQHQDMIEGLRKGQREFGTKSYDWVKTGPGQVNFVYRDQATQTAGLYHEEDPRQEVRKVIEKADLRFPQFVMIFGVGAGYMPFHFLKNRPRENQVTLILENDPVIFFRSFALFDFSDFFDNPDIRWILLDRSPAVSARFNSILQEYTTVNRYIKILATPMALRIHQDFYREAADNIMKQRDYSTVLAGNSVPDSFRGYRNTIENAALAIDNPGIRPWLNQFHGKTCISVAAGPSLNEHWETLKQIQGKVPIIAVDTVLKPMHDRGIYPDFVTAIERDTIVTDFFRGEKIHPRTSLVGPVLLLKETFEEYKGNQILFAPVHGYSDGTGLDFIGLFNSGYSAGNLNVTLAAHMGFKNIIMVGHNLAYGLGSQESHVSGTIDKSREKKQSVDELKKHPRHAGQIETQDGLDQVWTRLEWNQFRTQIEQRIEEFNDRRWINTAPKGAKIVGAELLPLEDALVECAVEDFDIYPYQKKFCQPLTSEQKAERLERLLTNCNSALQSLDHWIPIGERMLERLEKWEEQIQKLKDEGKKPKISFLDRCLNKVLRTKTKAVNEDLQFFQIAISVLMPAHVAFERQINQMLGEYEDDISLKTDFLLKHKTYFSLWTRWLPELREPLQKLRDELLDRQIDSLPPSKDSSSESVDSLN